MLTRYWLQFDLTISQLPPPGTLVGCGVTADSLDEALQLVKERVFHSNSLPPLKQCVEGVDLAMLDKNHVRPNKGNAERRGIWFSLGYDEAA